MCPLDLEGATAVRNEMKDFLKKMATLGSAYRHWAMSVHEKLKLEVSFASAVVYL